MRTSHYIFREVRRGFFRISHSRFNRTLSLRKRDNSICSGLYNLGTRTIAFACHYRPDPVTQGLMIHSQFLCSSTGSRPLFDSLDRQLPELGGVSLLRDILHRLPFKSNANFTSP